MVTDLFLFFQPNNSVSLEIPTITISGNIGPLSLVSSNLLSVAVRKSSFNPGLTLSFKVSPNYMYFGASKRTLTRIKHSNSIF